MSESEEERRQRLEADARRKRLRRANETFVERQHRLTVAAERQRSRRANETVPERLRRLAMDAERQRERRANESPLERQRRLTLDAERQRERRFKESTIEKNHRLEMAAERQRGRRGMAELVEVEYDMAITNMSSEELGQMTPPDPCTIIPIEEERLRNPSEELQCLYEDDTKMPVLTHRPRWQQYHAIQMVEPSVVSLPIGSAVADHPARAKVIVKYQPLQIPAFHECCHK